jgi:Asp-tRNA(Asn)/Glu-tRNA(Gln) amidotransferase A subunit family amidase
MSSELVRLTAVELRDGIASGTMSSVEVLEAFIERIETLNPGINAVTATCFERAREEAKAADAAVRAGDALGPLHGLPFAVKDLENTKDVLTTYGSPLFKDFVPKADSVAVARLRQAGAIMVGKTNTPEFGAGANTRNPVWGATGNPFNAELTAGGSSGGSAAALAADMLPICTGSDTGGSLRIPAAFCGVVGFRPSPGMVPAERRPLGWTPISVLGPMARNTADARLMFESQIGADPSDPLSFPQAPGGLPGPREIDLSSLRVAYSEDLATGIVDEPIARAFRGKIDKLAPKFACCDSYVFDFGEAERCFDVIRAVSFVSRYRDDYEADPMRLGPNVRANYELGAKMSLADFAWAHAEQTRIFRRFQDTFRDYDIVLAPTVAVSPFPWKTLYLDQIGGRKPNTYYHWLAMAWYITLTTNPAVSLPCGVDEFGMPFGLQVVGRFRGDAELFDVAAALEAASAGDVELERPLPDLPRIGGANPDLKSIVTSPPVLA